MFRRVCNTPRAWLLVVGYSFNDNHVNALIADGVDAGLRVAVADTQAPEVLFRRNADPSLHLDHIWSAVVAYSSMPFAHVFGGYPLARKVVLRLLGRDGEAG
jgi:hypothetical protein